MITRKLQFGQPPMLPKDNWKRIISVVMTTQIDGMRKNICASCGFGKLYDKNNVGYKITRFTTADELRNILEKIKTINQG